MAERSGKTSFKAKRAQKPYRLLADIGGTFARFALQQPGKPARKQRRYCCADFPDIVAAVRAYYQDAKIGTPPIGAAFAVAAPITGDMVRMTNHPWDFSIAGIRRALDAETLVVVNDFHAIAESIPFLTPSQTRKIGVGKPAPHAPIAVLGPGTGFGVGALVPVADDSNSGLVWHAIATEGGHASLAANTAREIAVIQQLRHRYSHVSIEHCLAGQGLINLYRALAEMEGKTALDLSPPDITRRARKGDPLSGEAIAMFCAMLGATAGDLALTFGARGGVYIAGGIVPKLGALFDTKLFRRRFVAKDRYRAYLTQIPTYLITHPVPALIGLAALLDRRARAAKGQVQR